MRLRQLFVIGLALSILGVGAPAWSQDDPRSCNDLMAADTPAYVVCTWMATPEEAVDIARFWLQDDGKNMIAADPMNPITFDCTEPGTECPTDAEGDGEMHDVGGPDVEGAENGGTPQCQNGEECFVDGSGLSATDKAAAQQTPAGQAAQSVAQTGMRIWIDTELADDYKAGNLAAAAKKVAALAAAQPGVVGIRFTSQLGYNQTFATADELDTFVSEATTALRALVPGTKLAAHTVVPMFGCGADETCQTEMTKKYPLLAPDRVGAWLAKGQIDQLALDSGHLATEYATWQIDAATAQRNQWIQVRARAWDAYGQISAEDASFAAAQLTEEQAAQAITDRVAATLQDDAAETVTLWTRWQNDQGQVSRVYGEKWAASTTWDQLKKLTSIRPRLATVYDPANPEVDVTTDLKHLSEVFGQVYLHAA
jgi:hypothetical protein